MNISEVIINNYKSIGKERNVLNLEQSTTAIIGKNESGKSNVLEALGNLPYFNKPSQGYYTNSRNRRLDEDISIVIKMVLNKEDLPQFDLTNPFTELIFSIGPTFSITGALSKIISNDKILLENIDKVLEIKDTRKVWNIGSSEQNKKRKIKIIDCLERVSDVILLDFEREIDLFKKLINHSNENSEELIHIIEEITSTLSNYYSLLPQIYYRDTNLQLNYSYDLDHVKESIKSKDIFYRLMIATGIDEEKMIRSFSERNEGERQHIRWEIEKKISKMIKDGFNKFYSQETVNFRPHYDGNILKISVVTNSGRSMKITERSNGLRWYLSLFIDISANDYEDSNVLFLFDEPGVHLHVNAQKELLNLFDNLCSKGHQVVYTTHSPSMINGDNILNIRVVEKKDDGDTVIFKSSYDQRLSSDSKMETLSPLVKAIGADLKFNLGPQSSKQNIVTEGITDYMYIHALLHHFNIENPPNIIPSAGADNVNRIISILMGWGYDFKVLLDYDEQGRREYNVLTTKLGSSLVKEIVFVNGRNIPLLEEMRSSPKTIEDLISKTDKSELSNSPDKDNKVLVAKEFHDKVKSGKIVPNQQTADAFKTIFDLLGIY